MTVDGAKQVLKILKKTYELPKWKRSADPFRTLVRTIISQNTNDTNAERAYESLRRKFTISPRQLSELKLSQIEKVLKPGGLYRNKAKTIKKASQIIRDQFNGSLETILALPLEDARQELLKLPGVGPKTTDVVLLFSAGKPTIPVDTHVERVSKRLGIAPAHANYESIRSSLESVYSSEDFLAVHLLLIQHGRRFCQARNPLCLECPVSRLCPSKCRWDKDD